ncbi:M20 family metallopeptidase [Nocardiopsis mangrovi]|uniref:M20 family metallopeptidase n=1 Tax=Nocardiopsis mangrovi TaxID=1179818 RepID=A0ABV9DRR0_9ACTN
MIEEAMAQARTDHASVVALTRELVRIPSRGGIDDYGPVLEAMATWLKETGLEPGVLDDGAGAPVALVCEIHGHRPGKRVVLDACLDTAGFGDVEAWIRPPLSGEIGGGWLHGRGAADSKSGAAVFAHIAATLNRTRDFAGRLVLLFDVDEHTGGFGGARAYFGRTDNADVAGVMIGYPGIDHLVVGGRGVWRARVRVRAMAAHSGGSAVAPSAIVKAAQLVEGLHAIDIDAPPADGFPKPPRITVTGIEGGDSWSVVPDVCTVNVDVRTTPSADAAWAEKTVAAAVADVDRAWPTTPPSSMEPVLSWPAFALEPTHPLAGALLGGAAGAGLRVEPKVAGPSNIGNYLAGLGIAATAGFGADYVGLHGVDERVRVESLVPVQAAYHAAVLDLLTG